MVPYVAGAGVSLLSWFAIASSADRPIGVTTAFENSAALLEKAAVPQAGQTTVYLAQTHPNPTEFYLNGESFIPHL